ncbi:MAG TPA: phosphoenolpyruvate carboxylase [Candidatus Binataceae bacterium]|nr:phosphoenolpyruvate carboxylase [Candidatus Binataceae bacterium]
MATARTSSEAPANDRALQLVRNLIAELEAIRARESDDPFSNPVLLMALTLSARIDEQGLGIDDLDELVQTLTADAFRARASRLADYLGETDPQAHAAAISDQTQRIAGGEGFGAFRNLVERCHFGVVFTAHPTYWMPLELALALVELGTGRTRDGATALDEAAKRERIAAAQRLVHRPPAELSIDMEHAWSVQALQNAHDALETIQRSVLRAAGARWPDRWASLNPRLISLASWVGYDQDGRTDLTWMTMVGKRLAIKRAALERHRGAVARRLAQTTGSPPAVLSSIGNMLDGAIEMVDRQIDLLAMAEKDASRTAAFARSMTTGRHRSLVDPLPLVSMLDVAVHQCSDTATIEELAVIRASIRAHGLSLAHTHVRLNSSQLHNAIRRQVGLETSPADPANRRSYFNAINELLSTVRPVEINFGDLIAEGSSAKRLMMTVAQMVKLIDSETPIRFLIAETETGFTLLTALYYARLFGIEEHVEISPLFETRDAFERGERVLEEALKSPHYRAYLKRMGRIAVQFGYSDSGRFIGQMAATFRIERLRLRIANLLKREGLGDLEVILFNTHGESLGRGGHPGSLADRLRYAAPPANRAEFSARGIKVREEESFQGGDGFLMFLTPGAARASLRVILEFALDTDSEAHGDPIYAAPAYAAEFFATVEQNFSSLVDDPDYAAVLDAFENNLLYRTGSRPVVREAEEWARPRRLDHPSQIRAITNNAILQQLGYLANTLYGVGRAAAKDAQTFAAMRKCSPRFRRAMEMVAAALNASDPAVLRAYTDIFNSGMWLNCGKRDATRRRSHHLAELASRFPKHEPMVRAIRRLEADHLMLTELCAAGPVEHRDRLLLLHAIRIAIIQQIALLAADIPSFSPQHGLSRDDLIARIMALDVESAVNRLARIFPRQETAPLADNDFGEPSGYRAEASQSYSVEHEKLFTPLLQLYDLARRIGSAINYEIGAMG